MQDAEQHVIEQKDRLRNILAELASQGETAGQIQDSIIVRAIAEKLWAFESSENRRANVADLLAQITGDV